ncbi:MAG: glycosyltransferase family 10, partial [Planctomycetota bacterium]
VLENSISDDYWTEKLSDAYLGWALPLYVGCKNIDRYVPSESLVQLTGQPMEAAAQRIQQQLGAGLSGTQHAALAEARDAMLNRYNPFARFAYWAQRLYKQAAKHEPVTIQPHKAFRTLGRGLLYRARQRIRGG